MNKRNKKFHKKGIALLFSIMLSAIFLSIALGVLSITSKELSFSLSVKDSNDAFYAADSGIECALYNDIKLDNFTPDQYTDTSCFGVPIMSDYDANSATYNFNILGLGSTKRSCAKIFISKITNNSTDPATVETHIISKGYNTGGDNDCNQTNLKSIERVIEVNY